MADSIKCADGVVKVGDTVYIIRKRDSLFLIGTSSVFIEETEVLAILEDAGGNLYANLLYNNASKPEKYMRYYVFKDRKRAEMTQKLMKDN
jgi:hypothetical protein